MMIKISNLFVTGNMTINDTVKQSAKTITEKRTLPQFQSINFDMLGKVVYQRSTTKNSGIMITADESIMKKIVTEVKDNCLFIYCENVQAQSAIELTIYSSAPLTNIALEGVIDEGSQIDVGFTNSINIQSNGVVDDLIIKGCVRQFTAYVKGTGDIDATLLNADNVDITQEGVGNIKAKANKEVSIELTGVGNVVVYGNAKCTHQNNLGIGKIKFKEKE